VLLKRLVKSVEVEVHPSNYLLVAMLYVNLLSNMNPYLIKKSLNYQIDAILLFIYGIVN